VFPKELRSVPYLAPFAAQRAVLRVTLSFYAPPVTSGLFAAVAAQLYGALSSEASSPEIKEAAYKRVARIKRDDLPYKMPYKFSFVS